MDVSVAMFGCCRKGRVFSFASQYLRNHLSLSNLSPVTLVKATIIQNLDHNKSPEASQPPVQPCPHVGSQNISLILLFCFKPTSLLVPG